MSVTAKTITDTQIRELLADLRAHSYGTINREDMRACIAALGGTIGVSQWNQDTARARCAELINERATRGATC